MSEEVTYLAPAKVNLFLRLLRKREDGFHEIQTRLAPVSLADKLVFRRQQRGGLEFTCSDPHLPLDDSNLVVRAVRRLEKRRRRVLHVAIHLEKHIPVSAGLGGGSSDAAATLMGLNELFDVGLNKQQLTRMAAELGSDIPFFLYESVCDCQGRGEIVEPTDFSESLPLLLMKPEFGSPTVEAYKNWRDSRELPGILYAPQHFAWGSMENSLERPVFEKYLVLAEMKMWLLAQPEVAGALMSGSGSTMFAVLREIRGAEHLANRARAHFGETTWTRICQTQGSASV